MHIQFVNILNFYTAHKTFVFLSSQQEEEGDDADISVTTSMSSHSIPLPIPSFPPLYGARYSETTANTATVATYGGLVAMEDSQDDDPESILDEHVQRVMKTPGCQSPGATNSTLGGGGRHTPPKSSRSPDGGTGPPHYPPHRGGGHSLPAAGVKGNLSYIDFGNIIHCRALKNKRLVNGGFPSKLILLKKLQNITSCYSKVA